MLHIWCQMDTALSPQLLPLISNTEQVLTLVVTELLIRPYPRKRFSKGTSPLTCVLSCVSLLSMFVSAILGRADRIETLQNGIEISISFLLVLSCEVITSIWMLQ